MGYCGSMENLHQYVLDQLERRKGGWPAIAQATRISIRSIEKIARGIIKNPGIAHVQALADYFRRHK
jgi:transcriptional regulator with XRE-family HTH domain